MIYDTYHGYWWKCDICGKTSSPDIPRYATGTSAMRAYKKHRKECKNQQEAKECKNQQEAKECKNQQEAKVSE